MCADAWNWPEVVRFCERQTRRWIGPGEDSRDAAQEAVLRAWRSRHQCATPGEPWGWLARICQREAARLVARRRDRLLIDGQTADAPAPAVDTVENIAVQKAVEALTSLDRTLIRLRYSDDQTCARIAELVGLPEGTVKVRLYRARLRLREVLADDRVHP